MTSRHCIMNPSPPNTEARAIQCQHASRSFRLRARPGSNSHQSREYGVGRKSGVATTGRHRQVRAHICNRFFGRWRGGAQASSSSSNNIQQTFWARLLRRHRVQSLRQVSCRRGVCFFRSGRTETYSFLHSRLPRPSTIERARAIVEWCRGAAVK